jgi:predicted secreted hydrolase
MASPSPSLLTEPPAYGFQLTFFRVRRELARPLDSRFAPSQIMLAHVAVTDLVRHRMHHDQHLLRQGFANAFTDETDTRVRLGDWTLTRRAGPQGLSRYQLAFRSQAANVALSLTLDAPLPPLLQGREGWSQKGPQPQQASRYVSEPQLAGQGQLAVDGQPPRSVQAQCWLDHEWSHAYLGSGSEDSDSRAVGWDWLGLNLLDGSAVMLFQMRRRNGSTLWTGGTWRDPSGGQQDLDGRLQFEPLANWRSPTSLSRYPVQWRVRTPQGVLTIEALFDAQEVDARRTTGFLYWEGAVRVLDEAGALRGWGYLEMTGYAGRVPL